MSTDEKQQEVDELHEDYYTILNVSRNATDKEITQAYHRLGLIYHPDKHRDPESKSKAIALFTSIKKAYDVLIDPHKRAIYDSIGEKGLKHTDWQIISRTKTPQEIRDEYERLERERKEKRLKELTNSIGDLSMNVDARSLFSELDSEQSIVDLFDFAINGISVSQSVEIPLTDKYTAGVAVAMVDDKYGSNSTSSLSLSVRNILSPKAWVEVSTQFGNNKGISVSGFRRLTQRCTGTLTGMFTISGGEITPIFTPTITYALTKNLVGQIQWQTGYKPHMKTTLLYDYKTVEVQLKCQLSVKNSYIGCELSKSFQNNEIKLHSALRYGFLGVVFKYGIRKKISEFSHVDVNMLISSKIGVYLNIRVDRGSQSFLLPIHLADDILPSAIFYGTAAPFAVYFILKKLVIEPYLKEKEKKEITDKKENLKNELKEKKTQAYAAQELMKEAYSRSIERESPNGLVILKAIYGKLPQQIENIESASNQMINVVVPLQVLVKDHSLQILSDSTKSDLQGFYDPCIGEGKSLYIYYKFHNQEHEAIFQDNEIVRLPKKSHLIEK